MTRQPEDPLRYVEDILHEMDQARSFVEGMTEGEFVEDERTVRAVVRCLEVVGEATKQIPEDLRSRYDEVPWTQMAGMRDRLIHAYRDVDRGLVWEAVTEEIPRVRPELASVLHGEEGADGGEEGEASGKS